MFGLQSFSPVRPEVSGDGSVPLEVLIGVGCESNDFDRLVPQTDATFHYDKFNRLRLHNNVTSALRASTKKSDLGDHHLQDQTVCGYILIIQFRLTSFVGSYSSSHTKVYSFGGRRTVSGYITYCDQTAAFL